MVDGVKQANLFQECAPGSSTCPKQVEFNELLTRFAEFYITKAQGFGVFSCPPASWCSLGPDERRRCKSIKQHIECCKAWLADGGEVIERTPYQQAVLDGREKMR